MAAAERIIPLLNQSSADDKSGGLPIPAGAVEIVCEAVSFRYGGQRGGVQDISLTVPAGSLTALVGASGGGKSTLARLLLGLSRPESGRITVGGVVLTQLDQTAWRQRLAWVPQQPFFCTGSIRENLLLGRPDADDAAIEQALQAVGLGPVLARLPQGLDTMLGDRGAGLSGGELRRLALGRVLLRDAGLVVLDEPTAGLDAANEQLVLDAVEELAVGRTVLVISHREATVARCGLVVELANGRLQRVVAPQQPLESAS